MRIDFPGVQILIAISIKFSSTSGQLTLRYSLNKLGRSSLKTGHAADIVGEKGVKIYIALHVNFVSLNFQDSKSIVNQIIDSDLSIIQVHS